VYDLDKDEVYNKDYSEDVYSKTGLCLKKIEELCGKNIRTFAYNTHFILALTEEGEVHQKIYIFECVLFTLKFFWK